jgi:ferric-dicitrate binding protein FerR (iron transport regulator)
MTMQETETSVAWKYVANTTHRQQTVFLPDSSKVTLQPESDLKFSTAFNTANREVFLEGEASFEVTHNPKVPFVVFANEVTTKVLGTTFIIRAIKNEPRITVVVKTGKVSVYADPKKAATSTAANEIILTPNQQVVYDKKQNELSKTIVEKPRVIVPQEEVRRMRFEDAPLGEIFKALEKAYGVDIEFDEEQFSSCAMTTVISDDDFFDRLDIICDAMGIGYTKEKDRIVISGAGCKAKIY